MSTAAITGGNLELSPMRVKFNGVDLGATKGGVKIGSSLKYADLMADQLGDTPIDSVLVSQAFTVKMGLAEIQKKDNWKIAFPWAKLTTSGPNKGIYAEAQVGSHLLAQAKELLIHPLSKDDSDLAGDYKFYKAAVKSVGEVTYGPGDQVVLEVEFVIFPDTSVNPARFFFHGDPAIGAVAAAVAAAVAGGGNTGNGTVTGVSAGASTVTETLTLTCLVGGPTGTFHVSGSVSGSIGLAIVGTPFVSSKVNLTINDGAADFVAGDTFTLAATGPNYT